MTPSYPKYYGRLARAVGLLGRQGRGAAVRAPRGGALRRARDGLPDLDLRAVAGRRASSAPPTERCARTRWSTSGAATSCGAWSASCARCPARSSRSACGAAARGALMATQRGRARHRGPGLPLRHLGGRRQDRRGRHLLPRRQARRHVARDRRGARRRPGPRQRRAACRASSPTTPATGSPTSTFRLCHIDVDVYQSAKDVFDWVWPRLSPRRRGRLRRLRLPGLSGRDASSSTSSACATTGWSSTTSTAMGSSSSADDAAPPRTASFGQHRDADAGRPLRRLAQRRRGAPPRRASRAQRVGDFGCGYEAHVRPHACSTRSRARRSSTSRSPTDLKADPRVDGDRGPAARRRSPSLEPTSLDVVLCLSVLEHLWEPQRGARRDPPACRAPAACALLNVPSWRGKRFLELSRVPARV